MANKPENKKETKVIITFPDELELHMVPGNELKHYELFQLLTTLVDSIAVGFWTAFFSHCLQPALRRQELYFGAR